MATDITSITDSSNVSGGLNPRQFQGLFDVIPFKATIIDTTMAADTAATCDVTVTGASLGDFVMVAPALDNTDCIVYGAVSAANTVTITVWNPEGTDAATPFSVSSIWKGLVLSPKDNVWTAF